MSDQQSHDDLERTPMPPNPYVIEHYGFAAHEGVAQRGPLREPTPTAPPSRVDAVGRPFRRPRSRVLAAGALGLLLAGGIGGVAAAAADTGPDGRGPGDRGGVSFMVRDGAGSPTSFDGLRGRR